MVAWAILPESPEIVFSAFLEPSAWSISLQSEPDWRAKKRSAVLVAIPTISQHFPNIFPVSHHWHSHRFGDIGSDPSYNKSCLAVWKTMSRIADGVGDHLEFLWFVTMWVWFPLLSQCEFSFAYGGRVSDPLHTHTYMVLIHGVSCAHARMYVSVAAWWQRFHHLRIRSEQMHTSRAETWPGSQILKCIKSDDISYHGSFRQMFREYD